MLFLQRRYFFYLFTDVVIVADYITIQEWRMIQT